MYTVNIIFYNTVLFLFPIFTYFIVVACGKIFTKEKKKFFFSIALYTSMFLYIKYSLFRENSYWLLLISLPVIIALIKKYFICSLTLSLVVFYYYNVYEIPYYIFLIELAMYILVYFINKKDEFSQSKIFQTYTILKAVFLGIFLFFFSNDTSFESFIVNVIIPSSLVLLIMNICYYILNKLESIVELEETVKKLENEKIVRDSLFKITHEIKNPIAVCKGYLDMFDVNDPEKSNRYILIMKEEIDRCTTLMEDFLDFSKIKVQKELVDIDLLVDDVRDSVNSLFVINDVEFKYHISSDELCIQADYDRLKQVLINLIKNAVEAVENKRKGIVELKIFTTKENMIISIKDNGCGMNKEECQNKGKPFFTTKKNGTGLGVCVSKEIINAHGGTIKYSSKKNIGTKVMIELPLCK